MRLVNLSTAVDEELVDEKEREHHKDNEMAILLYDELLVCVDTEPADNRCGQ